MTIQTTTIATALRRIEVSTPPLAAPADRVLRCVGVYIAHLGDDHLKEYGMTEALRWLLSAGNFMPHGHCFLWQPATLWLNVGSDALIAVSYFAIPVTIYCYMRRRKNDIRYAWVPAMFAAFILLCGATHVMEIVTVWNPLYRAAGLLKLVTGLVSAMTLLSLIWILPRAISLKTPLQLEALIRARTLELTETNTRLRAQIAARDVVERQLRLMVDELNHRVKNTLATVQAIASQTLSDTNDELSDAFQGRLRALAAAHDVLTRERWAGAELYDVAAGQLVPAGGPIGERIHLSGPGLRLSAKASLVLAMGLHELAINALKYGALSNQGGRIDLRWELITDAEPVMRLTWTERDGPAVVPPIRQGFGTRLIERILARDLAGVARLSYDDSEGCTFVLETALSNVAAPRELPPYPRVGSNAGATT